MRIDAFGAIRSLSLAGTALLLVLLYQNCGGTMNGQCEPGHYCTDEGVKDGTSSSSSGVGSESDGSSSSLFSNGNSSQTSFASGPNSGPNGSSFGSSSSGGGSGGGSGGSSSNNSEGFSTDLRITFNLQDQTITENDSLSLRVGARGPTALTYIWYFNNQPIEGAANSFSIFIPEGKLQYAGTYHVVVKDKNGNQVSSRKATVRIIEGQDPCPPGRYGLTTADFGFLKENFVNASGTFFLPEVEVIDYKRTLYSFPGAANGDIHALGVCRSNVPYINSPKSSFSHRFLGGSINFQCKNGKWKYYSSSCNWEAIDRSSK